MYDYKRVSGSENKNTLHIYSNGNPLSFKDVIARWKKDEEFHDFYRDLLIEFGGTGCFWEHPPISKFNENDTYEVTIIKTSSFEGRLADCTPFLSQVTNNEKFISFENLSKSAKLLIPNPNVFDNNCRDLIEFLTNAERRDISVFFVRIGSLIDEEISVDSSYRYLSTHGLGVIWLHVRLDLRPKYYHHRPYKIWNS